MSNRRRSRHLDFQRSMLRWGHLRRLRKGLVRARRHPLSSSALRDTEDVSRPIHAPGMGLVGRATRVGLPLIILTLMLILGRRYTLQRSRHGRFQSSRIAVTHRAFSIQELIEYTRGQIRSGHRRMASVFVPECG